MATDNYFKTLTDNLQSREKQMCHVYNTAIQLREKVNSQMVQLQELVHPKKWIILAEAKEIIKNETEYSQLNNCIDLSLNLNTEAVLEVHLDEKSVIEQVNEFIKENKVDNADVNNIESNSTDCYRL